MVGLTEGSLEVDPVLVQHVRDLLHDAVLPRVRVPVGRERASSIRPSIRHVRITHISKEGSRRHESARRIESHYSSEEARSQPHV